MELAILLTCFLGGLVIGLPVAVTLGVSSLAYLSFKGMPLVVIPQKMYAGMDTFVLLCIPGFILAGNLMNAGFYVGYRGEEHFSLGASTAVFGAVGLLAMLGFASKAHESWARRALPLVMGVVMLGLYGASGENTDIMAHVLGFLGGVLVFGLGALWMRRWDLPGPLASAYWTLGLVAAAAALTWLPQGP